MAHKKTRKNPHGAGASPKSFEEKKHQIRIGVKGKVMMKISGKPQPTNDAQLSEMKKSVVEFLEKKLK